MLDTALTFKCAIIFWKEKGGMNMVRPILVNTNMVRAILDNIKKCTRRNIKGYIPNNAVWGYTAFTPKGYISCRGIYEDGYGEKFFKLPCEKGDILYVRETWCWCPCWDCGMDSEEGCCDKTADKFYNHNKGEMGCYGYKASFGYNEQPFDRWYPSIHMPKEAARIFLKVTDVRVERLQDIDDKGAYEEGAGEKNVIYQIGGRVCEFVKIWQSTVDKKLLDTYGWDANPWVWVIEFEQCEKPQGWERKVKE